MKRSTLAISLSVLLLIAGALAIWFLIVAPRLKPGPAVTPPPVTTPPPNAVRQMHGALNVYLAAPEQMPAGVTRAELTLVKATLIDDADGTESTAFTGAQRVTLQANIAEKALSELVGNGSWTRLKLEFSPAAEMSMDDGTTIATLVDRRETTLTFQADLPISRTLALLARVPLEPALKNVEGTWTANVSPGPQKAESYVFGSFLLDPRGKSDVWTLPQMTLAEAIKADLGLDITTVLKGSQGFSPATDQPVVAPPQ